MFKILFALAIVGTASYFLQAKGIGEGDLMPAIEVDGYKSGVLDQQRMRGKVTVINYWATWCEACKVELKEFESQLSDLLDRDDFEFAFVSLDKDPDVASAWLQSNLSDPSKLIAHLYKDPTFESAEILGVDAFPMTFVVDDQGRVVHVERGFEEGKGSTQQIIAKVRKHLDALGETSLSPPSP